LAGAWQYGGFPQLRDPAAARARFAASLQRL
jgi:hypothetical protein